MRQAKSRNGASRWSDAAGPAPKGSADPSSGRGSKVSSKQPPTSRRSKKSNDDNRNSQWSSETAAPATFKNATSSVKGSSGQRGGKPPRSRKTKQQDSNDPPMVTKKPAKKSSSTNVPNRTDGNNGSQRDLPPNSSFELEEGIELVALEPKNGKYYTRIIHGGKRKKDSQPTNSKSKSKPRKVHVALNKVRGKQGFLIPKITSQKKSSNVATEKRTMVVATSAAVATATVVATSAAKPKKLTQQRTSGQTSKGGKTGSFLKRGSGKRQREHAQKEAELDIATVESLRQSRSLVTPPRTLASSIERLPCGRHSDAEPSTRASRVREESKNNETSQPLEKRSVDWSVSDTKQPYFRTFSADEVSRTQYDIVNEREMDPPSDPVSSFQMMASSLFSRSLSLSFSTDDATERTSSSEVHGTDTNAKEERDVSQERGASNGDVRTDADRTEDNLGGNSRAPESSTQQVESNAVSEKKRSSWAKFSMAALLPNVSGSSRQNRQRTVKSNEISGEARDPSHARERARDEVRVDSEEVNVKEQDPLLSDITSEPEKPPSSSASVAPKQKKKRPRWGVFSPKVSRSSRTDRKGTATDSDGSHEARDVGYETDEDRGWRQYVLQRQAQQELSESDDKKSGRGNTVFYSNGNSKRSAHDGGDESSGIANTESREVGDSRDIQGDGYGAIAKTTTGRCNDDTRHDDSSTSSNSGGRHRQSRTSIVSAPSRGSYDQAPSNCMSDSSIPQSGLAGMFFGGSNGSADSRSALERAPPSTGNEQSKAERYVTIYDEDEDLEGGAVNRSPRISTKSRSAVSGLSSFGTQSSGRSGSKVTTDDSYDDYDEEESTVDMSTESSSIGSRSARQRRKRFVALGSGTNSSDGSVDRIYSAEGSSASEDEDDSEWDVASVFDLPAQTEGNDTEPTKRRITMRNFFTVKKGRSRAEQDNVREIQDEGKEMKYSGNNNVDSRAVQSETRTKSSRMAKYYHNTSGGIRNVDDEENHSPSPAVALRQIDSTISDQSIDDLERSYERVEAAMAVFRAHAKRLGVEEEELYMAVQHDYKEDISASKR